MTAERAVPPGPGRYTEVARAAERAFRLLPAAPGELPAGPGRPGDGAPAHRINADPDTVERDLMRLVLTVVELLRQLMERQALHRVDAGDLGEDEEERLGATLMILHDRMVGLCDRYGLTMADLNLDLGPLGSLLPPDPPDPPDRPYRPD
ncbi:gas vesicle protein K [Streptomyces sp. LP05-1]|uniref:Gas vesicle protein K n=1 Tax=Streptomyces pyxinae TaxID=2970734 RepID=A0ABT2CM82_9ACTN|nr:gas vesicle protein K [Streptomyces sp. LP05-1]MCS0638529.1 gas vesicle protein K [Streptomyces sp. LP05-1]